MAERRQEGCNSDDAVKISPPPQKKKKKKTFRLKKRKKKKKNHHQKKKKKKKNVSARKRKRIASRVLKKKVWNFCFFKLFCSLVTNENIKRRGFYTLQVTSVFSNSPQLKQLNKIKNT